jgi:hypothetical protein
VTSRGPALAIEGSDCDAQRICAGSSRLSRDMRDAGLDAVDLQVRGPESIREILSTQPLRLANLADAPSNDRKFIRHNSHLSETDRPHKHLSTNDAQVRDSVGSMPTRSVAMSRAECEAWMAKLGTDWDGVLDEAGVPESQRYVVTNRWGKNPRQMAKVLEALERIDRKRKQPTEEGLRVQRMAEWDEIGRAIARVPELLARELERLRPVAAAANKVADGDAARVALFSPTPEPKKPRK